MVGSNHRRYASVANGRKQSQRDCSRCKQQKTIIEGLQAVQTVEDNHRRIVGRAKSRKQSQRDCKRCKQQKIIIKGLRAVQIVEDNHRRSTCIVNGRYQMLETYKPIELDYPFLKVFQKVWKVANFEPPLSCSYVKFLCYSFHQLDQ